MNRIRNEQIRRNQMCRDCWQLYQPHREKVTELLLQGSSAPTRQLCVLGAGNCNDLDLRRLASAFGRIHLVDLDRESLVAGLAAQQLADANLFVLHGDVDVSGLGAGLAAWSPATPVPRDEIRRWIVQATAASPVVLPEPQDVVVSVCLLSQLLDAVKLSLGDRHPDLLELTFAVRARHLRLLLELLRPGGRAVLITDFVSSVTCPELAHVDQRDLPALAARLIGEHNFFTGLNPAVLGSLFAHDSWLAARTARVQLSAPWRWPFPTRVYAVCAVDVRTRTASVRA